MVHTHPHSCEEGTSAPLPPLEVLYFLHGPSDPHKVINEIKFDLSRGPTTTGFTLQ
jgi:hypothetical protein